MRVKLIEKMEKPSRWVQMLLWTEYKIDEKYNPAGH